MTHTKPTTKGVEGGSITKHLMSEDEPADNTGPVFYVTGKNFPALIAQTDKHSEYRAKIAQFYIR